MRHKIKKNTRVPTQVQEPRRLSDNQKRLVRPLKREGVNTTRLCTRDTEYQPATESSLLDSLAKDVPAAREQMRGRLPLISSQVGTVDKSRYLSLSGRWQGICIPQNVLHAPAQVRVDFNFNTSNEVVTGEMSFWSPHPGRGLVVNSFAGYFSNDRELHLFYKKKDPSVIGPGLIVLKLSMDARKMEGHVTGTSSHTGDHFHALIKIEKGVHFSEQQFHSSVRPQIFIGHGRNPAWLELKKDLEAHGYSVETYESDARAGKVTTEILQNMIINASFAILVMTGEDETKSGAKRARQNVIHEIGMFQTKLGIHRAVILHEEGVEPFTNASGIEPIYFKRGRICQAFGQILMTIKREFPA
jgi:Predicted nucleotide-binding protein containing TIR-like domain